MTDIDFMRLRRLDLTILLVFIELMRHRRMTEAAVRLGLTQSAISHSLKRLRSVFDDPLFLRRPHGLEPTARAQELEPVIAQAIEALSAGLQSTAVFAPDSLDRPLCVGAYDSVMATIIPALLSRLTLVAPRAQLVVRPISRREAIDALQEGSLDLAIGFFFGAVREVIIEPLYSEQYCVVMRHGHALASTPLTAESYASARHLVVSPSGDLSGIVDAALAAAGLQRRVDASIPLFFPAMATAAETDLIATIPRKLATKYAAQFGLIAVDPPIAIRSFEVSLVRHRRNAKSGMIDWLAAQIRAA
jgi:DNA-binding transcriptional LysR family regulator